MSKRIKAVVMSHDCPENVDKLFSDLSRVFDDVEVFDSGSSPEKVPKSVTRSFSNIYWTGLWEEVRKTCQDYDAVWVLGGDVVLKDEPARYRESIEASLPFGCWSPSVEGRAKLFMQWECFKGRREKVWNIEGMAIAVSGEMLRRMGEFPAGNQMGYGQDLWMCWKARWLDLCNYIDGGVRIFHPPGTGYSNEEAGRQMEKTFTDLFGDKWRSEAFHFSDFFDQNLVAQNPVAQEVSEKKVPKGELLVATVDNGWGLSDFARIVGGMKGVKGLVVRKGVMSLVGLDPVVAKKIESVPYEGLEQAMKSADAFLFTRVGEANKADYERVLRAGIPTVVHKNHDHGLIEHQMNGFLYFDDNWAVAWLRKVMDNPSLMKEMESKRNEKKLVKTVVAGGEPLVSVITPTYKRDSKVVSRCVSCMLLQTEKSWEQIVCSDGGMEKSAQDVVDGCGDPRVRYRFTVGKKNGDFGNTVRKEMLEREVKGKYVLFLDDDNLIMPNYLEKMVGALEANPKAGFVVCRIMHFGPLCDAKTGRPPQVLKGDPVKLYYVDPLQVLVRREVMQSVGWDTEVGYLSDGVTLERLGNKTGHVRVEEVLGVHV